MPSQGEGHLRTRIGRNVRTARLGATLTQRGLAQLLGVDQMAVSRWERGIVTPTLESLISLADALDRDVGWFYDDHGEAVSA